MHVGLWELTDDFRMAGLQVEKLAGVAQDGFKLHQDQRLFIDPTLRGLKECEEVPVDRGKGTSGAVASVIGHPQQSTWLRAPSQARRSFGKGRRDR